MLITWEVGCGVIGNAALSLKLFCEFKLFQNKKLIKTAQKNQRNSNTQIQDSDYFWQRGQRGMKYMRDFTKIGDILLSG